MRQLPVFWHLPVIWVMGKKNQKTKNKNADLLTHGTVRRVCNFLGSARQNKNLKRWTLKPSAHHSSQCYNSILQLSFIQKIKGNTSLRHEGTLTQKTQRGERERDRDREHAHGREIPGPLALLFICFFLPLGLSYVNWAMQDCC